MPKERAHDLASARRTRRVYWCRQGKCSRSARRRPAFDADRHAAPCSSTPSSCRGECSATTNIPIVAMSEDLVRAKLVTSMRRPESNTTGVSIMGTEPRRQAPGDTCQDAAPRSTVLLLADPGTHRSLGRRSIPQYDRAGVGAHSARGHREHTGRDGAHAAWRAGKWHRRSQCALVGVPFCPARADHQSRRRTPFTCKRRASGPPPRLASSVVPEAEAPLPADPHASPSGEQTCHPRIRVRRDTLAVRLC